MIPQVGMNSVSETKDGSQPSRTYRLDTENKRVVGTIDDIESVQQAVQKILQTERYANMIYSFGYGAELEKFIGKDFDHIKSAIAGEIKEALLTDDRITAVTGFQITRQDIDSCLVSFMVQSKEGDIKFEEVMSI